MTSGPLLRTPPPPQVGRGLTPSCLMRFPVLKRGSWVCRRGCLIMGDIERLWNLRTQPLSFLRPGLRSPFVQVSVPSSRSPRVPFTRLQIGKKKYTPPPRKPSFFLFPGLRLSGVYPSFRTYGVYPFPLFSQENGIHHSVFCSARGRATDRERGVPRWWCILFFPLAKMRAMLLGLVRSSVSFQIWKWHRACHDILIISKTSYNDPAAAAGPQCEWTIESAPASGST